MLVFEPHAKERNQPPWNPPRKLFLNPRAWLIGGNSFGKQKIQNVLFTNGTSTRPHARERKKRTRFKCPLRLQIYVLESRLFVCPGIPVARAPAVESDSSRHRTLTGVPSWCVLHIGWRIDVGRQIRAGVEARGRGARRRRDSYSLITQGTDMETSLEIVRS